MDKNPRAQSWLDDTRTAFKPKDPDRRGPAFTLSLVVHVGLVVALAWGVAWRSDKPTPVAADLWAAVPQTAAPPTPPPPEPPKPKPQPPAPKPEPKPEPQVMPKAEPKPIAPPKPKAEVTSKTERKPSRDADIALEKARQKKAEDARIAEQKRLEALKAKEELERKEQQQREALLAQQARERQERERQERLDRQRQAEETARQTQLAEQRRAQAERERRDQQLAEDARLAKLREERLRNLVSSPPSPAAPTSPSSRGADAVDAAPSNAYKGRLVGVIKPNIVFGDPIVGNPVAEVEVRTASTGTIVSNRLLKSSGNRAWDQAVLKAVEKTAVLPKDELGRVPPVIVLVFSPQE